jgi:predicted nuclease of predicted toxin-antitoxin system
MKFFADINVSTHVVAGLAAHGHDVSRTDAFLPASAPDHDILAFVHGQGGALITRDQDFSALVALSGATAPSIVNLRHSRTDPAFLVGVLDHVLRSRRRDLEEGCIITVDDGGVRVHLLPVGRHPD